ncbi:MAG: amidase family protein [Pseudomonadota bacterium]|nr:amidase family protein [Pseudomonadota bacterium]
MPNADTPDYATATAGGLASALAARQVSALELCDAGIERIERLDGPINAVVVRDFERAREAAKSADAALARGERRPLLGVPMTVKEAMNVAGLATTWGLLAAKDFVATQDAVGVARLKAAGAVILGKTNVPPHLGDWQSVNPVYGRTNHPLDQTLTPGGSSGGGAAALAAGMVPLEFGSDIGGSIRVPSSFCGVFGHKPSWGLIPNRGHEPPGTDRVDPPLGVIGPMARTASDLELALDVLAGPDGDEAKGYRLFLTDARRQRLADHKVLVIDAHPIARADPQIVTSLDRLAANLEAAGVKVTRKSPLVPDLEAAHAVYMTLLGAIMSRGAPAMAAVLPSTSAHAWMDGLDAQLAVRRQWAALFEAFDVVLAPTFGVVAFPHDEAPFNARTHTIEGEITPYAAQIAWPGMATVANLPATAVPIGRTTAGLPIGAQIIGPYLEDRTTLAFARMVEREIGAEG